MLLVELKFVRLVFAFTYWYFRFLHTFSTYVPVILVSSECHHQIISLAFHFGKTYEYNPFLWICGHKTKISVHSKRVIFMSKKHRNL